MVEEQKSDIGMHVQRSETTINWYIWPHMPCACLCECMYKKAYMWSCIWTLNRIAQQRDTQKLVLFGQTTNTNNRKTKYFMAIQRVCVWKECELIRWKDRVKGTAWDREKRSKKMEIVEKRSRTSGQMNGRTSERTFECSQSRRRKPKSTILTTNWLAFKYWFRGLFSGKYSWRGTAQHTRTTWLCASACAAWILQYPSK